MLAANFNICPVSNSEMDRPKLMLVKSDGLVKDSSGGINGTGNEWLIDACDLEGVDVEEVVDEGTAGCENEMNLEEMKCKTEQTQPRNFDGQNRFEFLSCTECKVSGCTRPVQEICGHVKCRGCFTASDYCTQCVDKTEDDDQKNRSWTVDSKSIRGRKAYNERSDLSYNAKMYNRGKDLSAPSPPAVPLMSESDNDEKVMIKPDEYIFELGEESGTRSLAVVSSETLKRLGIQRCMDHKVRIHDNEISNIIVECTQDENETEEPEKLKASIGKKCKNKRKSLLLTDHIILESDIPRKYKCLQCKKDFMQEYQRKYHIYCNSLNGSRPYVCQCSEEFISQSHYLYHVRSKHTGEKPYKCPICSAGFIQKVKLNRHMITHTSNPATAANSSTYLCAYCKKRFTTLSSCRRHIRNHTEEKPFQCVSCEKAFKQKYSLDLHQRTHLQERPHQCPDCDKAFSTAKDMRRHHLIHTGELPFICAFGNCQAKFRRKDNLERHIRQTHKLSEKMARLLANEASKKYLEDLQFQKKEYDNSSKPTADSEINHDDDDGVDVITGF